MDSYGFDLLEWDGILGSSACKEEFKLDENGFTTKKGEFDCESNGQLTNQIKSVYDSIVKINKDEKILLLGDYPLHQFDVEYLLDNEWLSDSIISLFYCFLQNTQGFQNYKLINESDHKKIYLMPATFCFLLLNHDAPHQLREVMPTELFEADVIFCPVNDNVDFGDVEGGSHWSLLVVEPKNSKSYGYDSMDRANDTEMKKLTKKMQKIFESDGPIENDENVLDGPLSKRQKRKALKNKPKAKTRGKSSTNYKTNFSWQYQAMKTPQQINGSDCGVITLSLTALLIYRLQDLSTMNWELENVRIHASGARLWMLQTIRNLSKMYKLGKLKGLKIV